jgi:hypothetical protein
MSMYSSGSVVGGPSDRGRRTVRDSLYGLAEGVLLRLT